MTSLPTSPSEGSLPIAIDGAAAFERLHPVVRKWIWQKNWQALRDIQAQAVPAILDGAGDVIISAATASGKTEAAFLPVISAIAEDDGSGFQALYVSPLKALINDQFRRLEDLCEMADLPVVRWHGDVSASVKKRARENPRGIVLITPESLEALLVLRGAEIRRLFQSLRYVVVDELHAFIGDERGMQLQSLLHRLEAILERRVMRIGLSATLGDMDAAAPSLRHDKPAGVVRLESQNSKQTLRLQVRGYVLPRKRVKGEPEAQTDSTLDNIPRHLFDKLRGSHNLIFAGSRRTVEEYADALRGLCEEARLPNEFFPHHGNLSKELREEAETRLRSGSLPATAVCTTTLELGIDLGEVESVAQIGPPKSVAALRQRLGRSGRREGKAAVLWLYVQEMENEPKLNPLDRLRTQTVQAIAAVRLLMVKWCEPPPRRALHLSTLTHQVLALLAQTGGCTARHLFEVLCGSGPFTHIGKPLFTRLLRALGNALLIEQVPDGTLLLGKVGEGIVAHYSFYAVFESPEEYRVIANGKTLGMLPVDFPLTVGMLILFAGRRWEVQAVHDLDKAIAVIPAAGGLAPRFGGEDAGGLHDRLVAEMRDIYCSGDQPRFLNEQALLLLAEGRAAFHHLRLDAASILDLGQEKLLFPWVGSRKLYSLALALKQAGMSADVEGIAVAVTEKDGGPRLTEVLAALAAAPPPAPLALAAMVENKVTRKFDEYLTEDLLCEDIAASLIDADAVPALAQALLTGASAR